MNLPLEESTTQRVPKILEDILTNLFSELDSTESKQKEIFFILIIVIMMENKFMPQLSNIENLQSEKFINKEQLNNWKKSMDVYEVTFIMSRYNDIPLKLIMCPLGATVIVTVLLKEINSEVYSVCLPLSRYVVSPQASTIPMIFRDLKHFCHNFKNKIIAPVTSRILNYLGYPSASLLGIPEEILFNILLSLSSIDIINVSKTCRSLKIILDSNNLWHHLYLRDFNNPSEDKNDWKSAYKQAYIEQRENQLRGSCLTGALHDFMDISDYVSYIDNPLWDDIII